MTKKPTPDAEKRVLPEVCRNPWNSKCDGTDIVVAIFVKGEVLPLCSKCWAEIAESDKEW